MNWLLTNNPEEYSYSNDDRKSILEKMQRCSNYVGLACVDGSCPIANADVYSSMCMEVFKSCNECFYYKGCEDCALAGTEYCDKEEGI